MEYIIAGLLIVIIFLLYSIREEIVRANNNVVKATIYFRDNGIKIKENKSAQSK